MSQVNAKTLMLGQNADQSKNFKITVPTPEDGTLTIERGDGTDVMKFLAAGGVEMPSLPFSKTGGYLTLPNGFIVQWGAATSGASGSERHSFPIPFSGQYIITASLPNLNASAVAHANGATNSEFDISARAFSNTFSAETVYWIAIGY